MFLLRQGRLRNWPWRFLPKSARCPASFAMTHEANSRGFGRCLLPVRLSTRLYQLISRISILSMALMLVVMRLTWYTESCPE
ncbi:MAG: hypothetical protein ACYC4S_16220 [Rhodoferax sp.]